MKVKSKIVARYEDKGRLKAVATVCLDGKFLVTGVRVADCQKGLAVFMPSREIHAGEYRDICFPITSELYKQIKDSVLDAYARPEDDDPAYGDGLGMDGKAGQAERPTSVAANGHSTASGNGGQTEEDPFVATDREGNGKAPESRGQTGETAQADYAAMPETGILPENGRQTENPAGDGLSGETVQPEDTAQLGQ